MMKLTNSILFAMLTVSSTTSAVPIKTKEDVNIEMSMDPKYLDTSRIVGGSESRPGDYPYFVEMGGCGGALVAPDIVLFAAHCEDWKDKQLSIGAYARQTLANGAQERFCDTWIADPKYGTEGSEINYDFALCKLNEPVTIDTSFVSIELNENDNFPSVGQDLLVMGLGTLSSGGSSPNNLHNVTVPYISNNVCRSGEYYGNSVTDIMLCAGFESGGKDSCQGDSGGPIVQRTYRGDGSFVDTHVGVVSWGIGCAAPKKPGVYSRTSKRASWIKSTMCNQLNSVASFCGNNPSPPPPCGQNLSIRVRTDQYPSETSMTLRKNSGGIVLKREYLIKNYQNDHPVCLESNTCYTFTIGDSFGDGIEGGSFALSLNGQEIKSGNGSFGNSKTENFCTGSSGPNPVTPPPTRPPTNPPISNPNPTKPPTRPPTRSPTRSPIKSPTQPPNSPPTPVSGACGGNIQRQFRLELTTDGYGDETSWILSKLTPDFNNIEDPSYQGDGYGDNTKYVLPSTSDYYCLDIGRCYYFDIYDAYGDGMSTSADAGYKGFLAGVEIFAGSGEFEFGYSEYQFFCVEDGEEDPSTIPPTPIVTTDVTPDVTSDVTTDITPDVTSDGSSDLSDPGQIETNPPTPPPTPPPTHSPTKSPTPSPTKSPTPSPTSSPTTVPTFLPTEMTTIERDCSDSTEFRFKGKEKKTCKKFLKGKNKKKLKKKCNKKWKKKKVFDWCPETCGTKVGLGMCAFMQKNKP